MSNQLIKWQTIYDGPFPSEHAFDRDEELAQEIGVGEGTGIIRFYRWDKPAISLGRVQNVEEFATHFNIPELVPVVKRQTGGSAVWHEGDLAYSITIPQSEGLNRDLLYERINLGFCSAFEKYAIPVETLDGKALKKITPQEAKLGACVAYSSPGDLYLAGKKLGGSSQRIKRTFFQQQGFIGLAEPKTHPELRHRIFPKLSEQAITLEGAGYDPPDIKQLVAEMFRHLEISLNELSL